MLDFLHTPWFLLTQVPTFTRLGYTCLNVDRLADTWDFRGQRWLVTGASTGIGREVARTAARMGAEVIVVARDRERLDALGRECGGDEGRIVPMPADLALVSENRRVIGAVSVLGAIDVLVNNVGVLLDAPSTTAEGLDRACAINLVGPYVLTEGLLATGAVQDGGCIVNVSSGGMYTVPLDVAALDRQTGYDGVRAYAYHKRAQVVLTDAWRNHGAAGKHVYVMHPGWVATPGVERSLPNFRRWLGPWLRDAKGGADTILWLAAERPRQDDDGIWFDRRLRAAHVWHGSRRGDDVTVLFDRLREWAAVA